MTMGDPGRDGRTPVAPSPPVCAGGEDICEKAVLFPNGPAARRGQTYIMSYTKMQGSVTFPAPDTIPGTGCRAGHRREATSAAL
jgi:hypothetical protein